MKDLTLQKVSLSFFSNLVHNLLKTYKMKKRMATIVLQALDYALLGLSITVCVLLIFMWTYAYMHQLIPKGVWGTYEGNHGPWRGFLLSFVNPYHPIYMLRRTLMRIFQLQLVSIFLSAGYLLFKRQTSRMLLLILNIIYFFALGYTYYWLID